MITIDPVELYGKLEPLVKRTIEAMLTLGAAENGSGQGYATYQESALLVTDTPSLGISSAARKMAVGNGVKATDGGPGGTLTHEVDEAANLDWTGAHTFLGDKLTFLDGTSGTVDIGRLYSETVGTYSNWPTFGAYNEQTTNAAVELYAERSAGAYATAGVSVQSTNSESTTRVDAYIGLTQCLEVRASGATLRSADITSGSPKALSVTPGAHTTLAASTEAPDVDLALNRTVQFATGALTTQRAFIVRAPTYGFVGASTLTTAATLAITGAPAAGTNATITNAYALLVESGAVKLSGGLNVGTSTGAGTGDIRASGDIRCDGTLSTNGGTNTVDFGGYNTGALTQDGYVSMTVDGVSYKVLTGS